MLTRRSLAPRRKYFPTLTADNAYQLLDDVAHAVLEEPKRLNMKKWAQSVDQLISTYGARKTRPAALPMCNTVACVGGWIVGLARPGLLARSIANSAISVESLVPGKAARLLGWSAYDGATFKPLFSADGPDINHLKPGTRAYAEAVVRRIRTFQKTHQDRLLNTPVAAVVD